MRVHSQILLQTCLWTIVRFCFLAFPSSSILYLATAASVCSLLLPPFLCSTASELLSFSSSLLCSLLSSHLERLSFTSSKPSSLLKAHTIARLLGVPAPLHIFKNPSQVTHLFPWSCVWQHSIDDCLSFNRSIEKSHRKISFADSLSNITCKTKHYK